MQLPKGMQKVNRSKIYVRLHFPVCIGVLGTARGIGTTHFAVMAANCFANGMGFKTAVAEYNGHKDFMKICDEADKTAGDIQHFSYHGMDFHTCRTSGEAAKLSGSGYEVIVFDMDSSKEECLDEFIRADVRIAMCSTMMWRRGGAKTFFEQFQSVPFSAAAFAADEKECKALERVYRRKIWDVPKERDPFKMTPKNLVWMKTFIEKSSV